jgi:hypothetical protein
MPVDHIVDSSEPRGRVDIQVGPARRRRWSDEVKRPIVADGLAAQRMDQGERADLLRIEVIRLSNARMTKTFGWAGDCAPWTTS